MGMHPSVTGPMTIDEFYRFADTKPDYEKWELIGGEPILNAAPSTLHQVIVANVVAALKNRRRELKAPWIATPGSGVRVSEHERPEPDVFVFPDSGALRVRDRDDVIVVFEVLSPSTKDKDFDNKRLAYTSLPPLTHYVVIAQDTVEVKVFARDGDEFKAHTLKSRTESLELPSLGTSLPLSEIYEDTGL